MWPGHISIHPLGQNNYYKKGRWGKSKKEKENKKDSYKHPEENIMTI